MFKLFSLTPFHHFEWLPITNKQTLLNAPQFFNLLKQPTFARLVLHILPTFIIDSNKKIMSATIEN
jgi:hypothetical protein